MVKLVNQTVAAFLDELASSSPAPGGGSVAALSGALGAALSSMVCNLTIGKEKYADVQTEISKVLRESEQLRKQLTMLVDKDTDAFTEVVTALKLPKESDAEKQHRKLQLQKAYKSAALVPLETARTCVNVLDVARVVAENGNKNSITDAAVSALMAQAGVEAAVLNVRINLGVIQDPSYVATIRREIEELRNLSTEKTKKVLSIVETSLT